MFKKITLQNGLRIVTVPRENSFSQAVTALVLVGTGSKYENKRINGISHFLEHMYFKGTKKRKTPMDVIEPLDRVGGIYNAFTSQEFTGYFAKVETSNLEMALDWLSDIYLNSTLPAEEIEKEKGVISEEINMIFDHPMSHIGVLWGSLLYGDQPAGCNIAGTKESVIGRSRENLHDYMSNQYVAKNTVICFAGNFKEEKAQDMVEKYFADIKIGEPKQKPKVVESQSKPECLLEYRKTDQCHICLGSRAFNFSHPDRYAQELLGTILGGIKSSRLFVEIREKMGAAYYINTEVQEDGDTGFLVTQAGIDIKKIEPAISAILKEYRDMAENKISESELKKAKENVRGRMALVLETSDELASFYAGQEILEGKILTPQEIFAKIDKVTMDDLVRVAKSIFVPEKINLAVVGPFEDKEKFENLLKI